MNTRKIIPAVVALIAVLATTIPTLAASGDTVANARDATAAFNDPAAAIANGYDLLTDAAGIACIDQPGSGAMGIHYVNAKLIGETVDIKHPQAIMYEPMPNGKLELIAVEYITTKGPASLEGQLFNFNGTPNRYGLPQFYELHVWAWKANPHGAFADMNPKVSCEHAAMK